MQALKPLDYSPGDSLVYGFTHSRHKNTSSDTAGIQVFLYAARYQQ
jgi:hypothetical protein